MSYEFRAPQYVDFMNIDDDDDSINDSIFFARDLDNSSLQSDGCDSRRSSSMSCEDERTLTPSASDHHEPSSDGSSVGKMSPGTLTIHDMQRSNGHNRFIDSLRECTDRISSFSTPVVGSAKFNCRDGSAQAGVKIRIIPPTPTTILDDPIMRMSMVKTGSPNISKKSTCDKGSMKTADESEGKTEFSRTLKKTPCSNEPKTRRRSNSVSALTNDDVLKVALEGLVLSDKKTVCQGKNVDNGSKIPKRKRSPPPNNARDYSLQPQKFISMAEQIARNERTVPQRFRTLPKNAVTKKVQCKEAKMEGFGTSNISSKPAASRGGFGSSVSHSNENDKRGVKVPRWPAPKVEPFKLTTYTPKKLIPPKFGFNGTGRRSTVIRDWNTPLNKTSPITKVEPFSFHTRDQEFLLQKQNRIHGKEDGAHSGRRRSKSQGDEVCLECPKRIPQARPATVLHKPPFIPVKAYHKPTKPVQFELCTEKRAKERELFAEHLRKKDEERAAICQARYEMKKQEEERKLSKLRKELVHKARHMPSYNMMKIQPSTVPLTSPETPRFMHKYTGTHSHK